MKYIPTYYLVCMNKKPSFLNISRYIHDEQLVYKNFSVLLTEFEF